MPDDTVQTPPMMKCGCRATGTLADGSPVCTVHVGIVKEAEMVNPTPPDLVGRLARCPQCDMVLPSSLSLTFFEYRPTLSHDSFYCGCRGWD